MSQQSIDHAPVNNRPTIAAVDLIVKDYKVNFLGPKLRTNTTDTIDVLTDRQNDAHDSASLRLKVQSLGGLFRRKSRSRA